jgi:Tfp pilus assembly protein PilO
MTTLEIIAAFATIAISILGGLLVAASNAGRLETRITNLEKAQGDVVTKAEWVLFLQELRDRLTRIENKLDKVS